MMNAQLPRRTWTEERTGAGIYGLKSVSMAGLTNPEPFFRIEFITINPSIVSRVTKDGRPSTLAADPNGALIHT